MEKSIKPNTILVLTFFSFMAFSMIFMRFCSESKQ